MNEGPPAPAHQQTISKSSMVIYFLKLCVCVCGWIGSSLQHVGSFVVVEWLSSCGLQA